MCFEMKNDQKTMFQGKIRANKLECQNVCRGLKSTRLTKNLRKIERKKKRKKKKEKENTILSIAKE